MAYKPSKRRLVQVEEMQLDIKPVMNLMVVLIPLLLAGSEFTKLAIKELNLPPQKAGGAGAGENENTPKEEKKLLGLKITISDRGFYIANDVMVIPGTEEGKPTIPLLPDGRYDYDGLKQKLIEIKEKIVGKGFEDENMAIIAAEAKIEYQTLVKVMDIIETYEKDGQVKELFPQIAFGTFI
jgi:biopolymer transport protein ExbD